MKALESRLHFVITLSFGVFDVQGQIKLLLKRARNDDQAIITPFINISCPDYFTMHSSTA